MRRRSQVVIVANKVQPRHRRDRPQGFRAFDRARRRHRPAVRCQDDQKYQAAKLGKPAVAEAGKSSKLGQGFAQLRRPARAASQWRDADAAGGKSESSLLGKHSTSRLVNYTSRLCSTAASMNDANNGCGSNGRDFSSGWNCTPTNHGCFRIQSSRAAGRPATSRQSACRAVRGDPCSAHSLHSGDDGVRRFPCRRHRC